jgi:hypothetical protein
MLLQPPFSLDSIEPYSANTMPSDLQSLLSEATDFNFPFTLQFSQPSLSYLPPANQIQISHARNFAYSNAIGLPGLASSNFSEWNSFDGRQFNHRTSMLSVASHENLIAAQNPAYMHLLQHVATLSKDCNVLQAQILVLECVFVDIFTCKTTH